MFQWSCVGCLSTTAIVLNKDFFAVLNNYLVQFLFDKSTWSGISWPFWLNLLPSHISHVFSNYSTLFPPQGHSTSNLFLVLDSYYSRFYWDLLSYLILISLICQTFKGFLWLHCIDSCFLSYSFPMLCSTVLHSPYYSSELYLVVNFSINYLQHWCATPHGSITFYLFTVAYPDSITYQIFSIFK